MVSSLISGPSHSVTATIISTFLHTIISLLLRVVAISLLFIQTNTRSANPTWRDESFKRVWWVALGWAAAEAAVGIKQGYEGITLYRDVLVSVRRGPELGPEAAVHAHRRGDQSTSHTACTVTPPSVNQSLLEMDTSGPEEASLRQRSGEREPLIPRKPLNGDMLPSSLQREVEHDLDQLIAIKSREELEEVYGMPVIVSSIRIYTVEVTNLFSANSGVHLLSASYQLLDSVARHIPFNFCYLSALAISSQNKPFINRRPKVKYPTICHALHNSGYSATSLLPPHSIYLAENWRAHICVRQLSSVIRNVLRWPGCMGGSHIE